MNPLVSVVMSVFNGGSFLGDSIESICRQSYANFEFIIIDDGSTDDSESTLASHQKCDPRIHVHRQDNKGLIESLNKGCTLAAGKYIARMDADDIAIEDRLLWQVEFMEANPEVAVLGGALQLINANNENVGLYRYPTDANEIDEILILGGCPIAHPAALFKREVFQAVGGYRTIAADAEDYDLWLRIADSHKLTNLDAVILRYRRHSTQVSAKKFKQQSLTNLAVRTATILRRRGQPDPLDQMSELSEQNLGQLGLSKKDVDAAVTRGYLTCIRNMADSGEVSVALSKIDEMLASKEWMTADRSLRADFFIIEAMLAWRRRELMKSLYSFSRAIAIRPIILARPIKPLLRLAGLVGPAT